MDICDVKTRADRALRSAVSGGEHSASSRKPTCADPLRLHRARYHDTTVGRWISEDPIEFEAGDTNLARFVGNAPTNFTDATGLQGKPPREPIEAPLPTLPERPPGSKENRYKGIGEWTFKNEKEALEFFDILLDPNGNKISPDWVRVVKDGCIGLALVRIGWAGAERPPPSPLQVENSVWYTDEKPAKLRVIALNDKGGDYILVAAQLPILGRVGATPCRPRKGTDRSQGQAVAY